MWQDKIQDKKSHKERNPVLFMYNVQSIVLVICEFVQNLPHILKCHMRQLMCM